MNVDDGALRRARARARARWLLVSAAVLAASGCGGGAQDGGPSTKGVASGDNALIASTAAGGQVMPLAVRIQDTDRWLDVAIDGGGAFVLRDPRNGTRVLSRRGRFDVDAQGQLVNDEGWLVEGASTGATPSTLDDLAPLSPIAMSIPAVATRKVALTANLDPRLASLPDDSGGPLAFDAGDADTFTNSTSLNLHDAAGKTVSLTFYFRKLGTLLWEVHALAEQRAVRTDADGKPQAVAQLSFHASGSAPINASDAHRPLPPFILDVPAVTRPDGTSTLAIPAVELDLSGLSAFFAPFGVTDLRQDGSPTTTLSSVSINSTGELMLAYGHVRVDKSRRLVLARTTVADRLLPYGQSGWVCNRGCLSPMVALPGQKLTGMLIPGALNVGP